MHRYDANEKGYSWDLVPIYLFLKESDPSNSLLFLFPPCLVDVGERNDAGSPRIEKSST